MNITPNELRKRGFSQLLNKSGSLKSSLGLKDIYTGHFDEHNALADAKAAHKIATAYEMCQADFEFSAHRDLVISRAAHLYFDLCHKTFPKAWDLACGVKPHKLSKGGIDPKNTGRGYACTLGDADLPPGELLLCKDGCYHISLTEMFKHKPRFIILIYRSRSSEIIWNYGNVEYSLNGKKLHIRGSENWANYNHKDYLVTNSIGEFVECNHVIPELPKNCCSIHALIKKSESELRKNGLHIQVFDNYRPTIESIIHDGSLGGSTRWNSLDTGGYSLIQWSEAYYETLAFIKTIYRGYTCYTDIGELGDFLRKKAICQPQPYRGYVYFHIGIPSASSLKEHLLYKGIGIFLIDPENLTDADQYNISHFKTYVLYRPRASRTRDKRLFVVGLFYHIENQNKFTLAELVNKDEYVRTESERLWDSWWSKESENVGVPIALCKLFPLNQAKLLFTSSMPIQVKIQSQSDNDWYTYLLDLYGFKEATCEWTQDPEGIYDENFPTIPGMDNEPHAL